MMVDWEGAEPRKGRWKEGRDCVRDWEGKEEGNIGRNRVYEKG